MNDYLAGKAQTSTKMVTRVQALEDKNRRLKILHFDQQGKVLLALCEPIDEKYQVLIVVEVISSESTIVSVGEWNTAQEATSCGSSSSRRHLELVWVPTTRCIKQPGARTCRRLAVSAAGFGRRLRDVAYCASQDGSVHFGVVYVVEPAVGAGALWGGCTSFSTLHLWALPDEASCRKNSRLCNQKRYLVTLDVERECKPCVSELAWPTDEHPNPALRKSELKLFHLTK